jgi:hypothetical protein
MTVITDRNFDGVVSTDMVEEYWYRVRRALTDVIGRPADLADDYRTNSADRHGSDRMWLYRDEPLQLAADLAGHELTAGDADRYAQLFPEPILPGQPAWSLP